MDLKYDTNQNNQKIKDAIEMTKLLGEALKGSIEDFYSFWPNFLKLNSYY